MAKVLKHVFVQCFSFGDIHQLFLVRVGRTTQISDLSTAQTMNDEIIEYLVLTVVCSSQSFFFLFLLAFSFRFPCILTESSSKRLCLSPSFHTLRQPKESICFLGYFIHHFFVFLLFFFLLTSSTAALPLCSQLFSAFIPGIIRDPLLVGYFPLKPAGINGVFNKLES